jgi:CheY-like chemotaxis protein
MPADDFDLVLLDIRMPGRDGVQVFGDLKSRAVTTAAMPPVIAMTANIMAHQVEAISKPASPTLWPSPCGRMC